MSYFSRETQRRRKQQLECTATTSSTTEETCPVEQLDIFDPDLEIAENPNEDYLYDDTLIQPDEAVRAAEANFIDVNIE